MEKRDVINFYKRLGDSPANKMLFNIYNVEKNFELRTSEKIKWADIEVDLHASGIVVTNEGIRIKTNVISKDKKMEADEETIKGIKDENEKLLLLHNLKFHSGQSHVLFYPWEEFDPQDFTSNNELENYALLVDKKCCMKFIQACINQVNDAPIFETESKKKIDERIDDATEYYNETYKILEISATELRNSKIRAIDTINYVEHLINSIANTPKEFDTAFEEIDIIKNEFLEQQDAIKKAHSEKKKNLITAGVEIAGGLGITFFAPSALMWTASTFGTASTGVAISTLAGAAKTSASLAWLGGGALAAGGHGMAQGTALLALAGPIGVGIAGASLLGAVILFANNKVKTLKEKEEYLISIKNNIEALKEAIYAADSLNENLSQLKDKLNDKYFEAIPLYNLDYNTATVEQKQILGALVNNTASLSSLVRRVITDSKE